MTDNIKLPPMPESIFHGCGELWTLIDKWSRADPGLNASVAASAIDDAITRLMNKHAIEAVRLNAQAVPEISTEHGPWIEGTLHEGETYCKRCLVRSVFAGQKKCDPHIVSAPAAPQPVQAEQTDARDAARWRYIAWHIGVAWNEQGFTSLVRIVSDKHREMLGDMVDRMMAGDWPEAAPQPAQQNYLEMIYEYLVSTAPVGYADEAFRQVPEEVFATDSRNRISERRASLGQHTGTLPTAFGQEEVGTRQAGCDVTSPQPAQQDDDEGDALTVAYLHGHGKGKDSVQPLLAEKDALLRQALEALENGARVRNAEGGTKYQPPIEEAAIKAIRNHLGVKND